MAAGRRAQQPGQRVPHESLRKKRRAPSGGGMSLNMTPMIDVTFLLLIFFVVATNFVREGALISKLPDTNPKGTPPPRPPITIKIDDTPAGDTAKVYVNNLGGRAFVNADKKVEVEVQVGNDWIRLADYLKSIKDQSGYSPETTTVFIKPSPGPAWQFILAVYSNTMEAGYKEINWSGGQ